MTRKHINILMAGTIAGLSIAAQGAPTLASSDDTNMMLIFDASGSMKRKLEGGETRLNAAKKAMSDVLGNMEEGINLGLTMYGHRVRKQCTDIELVTPIGSEDADAVNGMIQSVEAKGETPIADSIRQAVKSFKPFKGANNRIVLITDGIEECGGNVCEAAQFAKDAGVDLKIDVVGFTLNNEQKSTVSCVADITGGKYYDAADASALNDSLKKAVKKSSDDVEDEQPAPQGENINLIAAANGAELVVAPNPEWARLTDGKEEYSNLEAIFPGGQAIWSFAGGKSATFDRFEWRIEGQDGFNLRAAEILASDSMDSATFKVAGGCLFENVLLMKSTYQACTFAPVTAKYVMFRPLVTYSSQRRIANSEMRLFGKLEGGNVNAAESVAPSPNPATSATLQMFVEPKVDGSLVDICDKPGGNCEGASSQLYCEKQGFKTTIAFAGGAFGSTVFLSTGEKISGQGLSSVLCAK